MGGVSEVTFLSCKTILISLQVGPSINDRTTRGAGHLVGKRLLPFRFVQF